MRQQLYCTYNLLIYILQEKQEREEEERKRRIQLYVFISRCIAYPFNAKQPTDMTRRQTKITKHQLETISARFVVSIISLCNIQTVQSVEFAIIR